MIPAMTTPTCPECTAMETLLSQSTLQDDKKALTPEEKQKQKEQKKALMNALWKCKPNEGKDIFGLGGDIISKALKGESIAESAKVAAVQFCQNTTNCYIRDQIKKLALVFGGGAVLLAVSGGTVGYFIGKSTTKH